MLHEAFADSQDVSIKASKLLQILKRWKAHESSKQAAVAAATRGRRSAVRRPSSCSRLPLVPLRCLSFHLHSDDEGEDEDYEEGSFAANPSRKSSRIGSPRTPTRQAPARALSLPKLSSPLSSCTPFSGYVDTYEEQRGEELEWLNPSDELLEERCGGSNGSSKASLPLKLQSKGCSTPKGYLAVYVGEERRRFVVKANLLNHPLFGVLLEKAREEFGFEQKGPLNIPCEIAFFQHIMLLMESNDTLLHTHVDYSTILLHSHTNSANNLAATVFV